MKRATWFFLAFVAFLWTASMATFAQGVTTGGNSVVVESSMTAVPENDAQYYGYVELVGPRTYNIVEGDTLWDLTPNDWRVLQAHNPQLSGPRRETRTENGRIRIHLNIDEPIEIPAGLRIRVNLARNENFVDNPTTGGQPFVQGGLNTDRPDRIRGQALDMAAREFNRQNPNNAIRSDQFTIVGDIETGRLHGPGIVYFADRPNEGRPTVYNGERGYRAQVRNSRTSEESVQMFLHNCGNDARQGNFLRGNGESFRFVPDGTVAGTTTTTNEAGAGTTQASMWPSAMTLGLIAAVLGGLLLATMFMKPNIPSLGRFNPANFPHATGSTLAPVTPMIPRSAPAIVSRTEATPMATIELLGTRYTAPADSGLRVEMVDGKARVRANGQIEVEQLPKRTRPRAVRPKTDTGTGGPTSPTS